MYLFEFDSPGGYVYHATFTEYLPVIQKEGLQLFKTSNWIKADQDGRYQGDTPGVYAFSSPIDAFSWAFHMQWEHKQPASILRIKDTGSWGPDPSDDYQLKMGEGEALFSPRPIPASAIDGVMHFDDFEAPVSDSFREHPWVTG